MEAGSRSIQQKVNGEGRVVLFIGTAEHPVVVHDGAPDPLRVEVAAAGDPGVGLLVDEDAVAYLFGQPQHDAAVKLEIFRIVRPVPLSLKLGLFGQDPATFLLALRDQRAARLNIDVPRVQALLDERAAARAAKDFARSDELRAALAELGVAVRDTVEGQVWDIA